MRPLVFALLLVSACDPDLTVAKATSDAGSEGGGPGPGPGPSGSDGGTEPDGGGDTDGAVEEDAGAPGHKIDGVDDFKPSEKFITSSPGYEAFVTWDDKRVYFGMSGDDVGSGKSDRWVLIYIGGTGGTTTGLDYGGKQQPTLPFEAGYHVRWKADGSYTNGQRWDGQSWVDAAGAGLVPVAMQKGKFMEMSINRAAIGNPATLKVHLCMLIEGGNADWTYSGVPSTSFTDGLDPNYGKYFELDLSDLAKAPNSYPPKP